MHGQEQLAIDGMPAHNSLCDVRAQVALTMTPDFLPFANKPKGIVLLSDVYKAKRERRRKPDTDLGK